jgi:hypothetical protein
MNIQMNELHGIGIRDKRLFTWLWMMEVFDLMKHDPISKSWQNAEIFSFKWWLVYYHNPRFGFMPKTRAYKGASQEWTRESHFMLLGVQESVREWTLTLASGLPLGELESQWTLEFSEGDFKGQNSLDWKVLYIIEKLLKRRCLKWACMTHLSTQNISYG